MKLFRNDSNADLLLKKHFLLSMLKTVLLVNMFEETMTFFSRIILGIQGLKQNSFETDLKLFL